MHQWPGESKLQLSNGESFSKYLSCQKQLECQDFYRDQNYKCKSHTGAKTIQYLLMSWSKRWSKLYLNYSQSKELITDTILSICSVYTKHRWKRERRQKNLGKHTNLTKKGHAFGQTESALKALKSDICKTVTNSSYWLMWQNNTSTIIVFILLWINYSSASDDLSVY